MKDERLVRGKAAAHHNTVTEGPPAEAADGELLTRIASGSEEAFRMLWDRFGAAVFTVCRRRLSDVGAAEDATQEAFTSVWRRAGRSTPPAGRQPPGHTPSPRTPPRRPCPPGRPGGAPPG